MNILIVLASQNLQGDVSKNSKLWLEEFVVPCCVFKDASAKAARLSPSGLGSVLIDSKRG